MSTLNAQNVKRHVSGFIVGVPYCRTWLREWRLNRWSARWLKKFKGDVHLLYRMGYDTDEIVWCIRERLLQNNDTNDPNTAMILITKLRGRVTGQTTRLDPNSFTEYLKGHPSHGYTCTLLLAA